MEAMVLKVLGRTTSINVRKVLWTLGELGAAYEREDWGMPIRDPKVPEFLALNPNGQVPVIVEDGFVLSESSAIMRYLCLRAGDDRFYPADLRERSIVEQWLSWQGTELNPQWGYAVYALLRKEKGFDDEARIAHSLERWGAKMKVLDDQLEKTGAFVAASGFSIADISLGLSVRRWLAIPRELPALPAVAAYYKRLRARPAGAEWLSEPYF
jgi:glutathione S-transferase